MFKSRTMFIIGAGGSAEVGLPFGDEFKTEISRRMDFSSSDGLNIDGPGDHAILAALRNETGHDINEYLEACWKIQKGIVLANSIDNFIDSHRGDQKVQLCGKLAIVRAIVAAERKSKLFFDPNQRPQGPNINFEHIQDSYFVQLWRLLQVGIGASDLETIFDNVAFITFNYDRCIEHFLYHALQQYFSVQQDVAENIISRVPIIHIYGTVGMLPWQNTTAFVPFGGYERGSGEIDLPKASEGINTYTEQIEDSDLLQDIHAEIDQAETVVFLGFSYFPENMRLLTPPGSRKPLAKRVFGTAYGLSESAVSVVRQNISELYPSLKGESIQVSRDRICGPFLQEYERELTQ